jgi:hypothetical protein
MLSRHDSEEIRYLEREAFEAERDAWEPLDFPEDRFPIDEPPAVEPGLPEVELSDDDCPF